MESALTVYLQCKYEIGVENKEGNLKFSVSRQNKKNAGTINNNKEAYR